ncbi:MAG TPA: hypothetical protein VN541_02535 [Tepidisphaeraceae bacterium]|nr:hypothetical protein [Tepidisphaeraceae bacterium]
MTYTGQVKGGVIVLEPGPSLPDGTRVRVEPMEISTEGHPKDNPLSKMTELAVETGIDDLATNVDHYLYGHPKKDAR